MDPTKLEAYNKTLASPIPGTLIGNYIGIVIEAGGNAIGVAAPTFPSSNSGVINQTGQQVNAVVSANGATISDIILNTGTYALGAGVYPIAPGDTFAATYTGGPPQWSWLAEV